MHGAVRVSPLYDSMDVGASDFKQGFIGCSGVPMRYPHGCILAMTVEVFVLFAQDIHK